MSSDLPAAHSMDTRWFAVDRSGHVGVFDSGENGDVPESWSLGQDGGYRWVERLLAIELRLDLAPFEAPPPARDPLRASGGPVRDWERSYGLLVRASSPRLLDLLPALRPLGDGRFAYAEHIAFEELEPLLASGIIERLWCDTHPAMLLGAYTFEGGWGSYSRRTTPRDPLPAADLPAEIRGALVDLSVVSFHETEELVPSTYTPCYSWGNY